MLLNVAAVTNRPPAVNAGPDTLIQNTRETVLRPTASDPDDDMLSWELFDETGRRIATYPNVLYQDLHPGDNTITVTVDDGHGNRATDSVVYTVESTDPPLVFVERPAENEVVPAAPYTIRWNAGRQRGNPLARFDVFSSADNGANWTAIAECTGLGPRRRGNASGSTRPRRAPRAASG